MTREHAEELLVGLLVVLIPSILIEIGFRLLLKHSFWGSLIEGIKETW